MLGLGINVWADEAEEESHLVETKIPHPTLDMNTADTQSC